MKKFYFKLPRAKQQAVQKSVDDFEYSIENQYQCLLQPLQDIYQEHTFLYYFKEDKIYHGRKL